MPCESVGGIELPEASVSGIELSEEFEQAVGIQRRCGAELPQRLPKCLKGKTVVFVAVQHRAVIDPWINETAVVHEDDPRAPRT